MIYIPVEIPSVCCVVITLSACGKKLAVVKIAATMPIICSIDFVFRVDAYIIGDIYKLRYHNIKGAAMTTIRNPAVAGMFYPDNYEELHNTVIDLMKKAKNDNNVIAPKVIIAPHAGYVYSGQIAAEAYKAIEPVASTIKKVILVGPAHRVAFKGIAVPSVEYFMTPLGKVKLSMGDISRVVQLPFVGKHDGAHAQEHSLEVQIPFLQEILGENIEVVPLVIGDASPEQVGAVLELLWGGPDVLIVISSDLSHYHNYKTANQMDQTTSDAIIEMNGDVIDPDKACGSRGIKGLLHVAKKLNIEGRIINVCNSGDTHGDKERVVGYGAYHFGCLSMDDMIIKEPYKEVLLALARQSIQHGLEQGEVMQQFTFPREYFSAVPRASFVTLQKAGILRGCIGSLTATIPLPQDVMQNAFKAAFQDLRFPALTVEEFEAVDIHISVLSPSSKMSFSSEEDLMAQLRPGVDGLILADGQHRGTFLPSVWESITKPEDFITRLKNKAGLPDDHWSDTVEIYRYSAQYLT